MGKRLAALWLLNLASCVPTLTVVSSAWIGGQDRVIADEATAKRDLVLDEASREWACEPAQISAAEPTGRAYLVTGCGHRGVFVIAVSSYLDEAKGEIHYWLRAVNVTHPVEPPATPLGSVIRDTASIQRWISLVNQGARDLSCPPEQVTPDFLPQGRAPVLPIVEGCGKRATYLSEENATQFRLSALVPMTAPGTDGP